MGGCCLATGAVGVIAVGLGGWAICWVAFPARSACLTVLNFPVRLTASAPLPDSRPAQQTNKQTNKQLRQALALATALGRAVVLPPLWCGLDRYWAPHGGTLPGSKFRLPFVCPADHILDLEGGWARDFDA